jgi:hypothetical protein
LFEGFRHQIDGFRPFGPLTFASLRKQLIKRSFTEIDEVQTTVEQMNLSDHHSGMYLVKVKSAGLPDATRRVVKQ